MKISSENTFTEQQKKIERSRQRILKKQENDVKKINKLYDGQIDQIRDMRENDLIAESEKSQKEIAAATADKEYRLEGIKKELSDLSTKFNEQKVVKQEAQKSQIDNLEFGFSDKRDNIISTNDQINRDIVTKSSTQIKDIKFESDQGVNEAITNATIQSKNIAKDTRIGIQKSETDAKIELARLKETQSDHMKFIKETHTEKVSRQSRKNKIDYGQRITRQQAEVEKLDEHHKEILKQKRVSFKEKFDILEASHSQLLGRIKHKFDSQIGTLVKKYSEFKDQTMNKVQDDFYNVSKLQPQIKDHQQYYTIEIEVPKHERELVNVTAQQRDIRLSMSRQYKENLEDLNGSNTTKRSEVLSKTFKVADVIDSRAVTQKYENGILSFKIEKL